MTGSAAGTAHRAASGWPIPRPALWAAQAALVRRGGYAAVSWGLLVQGGVIARGADADGRALACHACLWDPWFPGWGLLVLVALVTTRPAVSGVT